jgi:hypothetical protein
MPSAMSPTSTVTTIAVDYEAIERAIRETSRGRWFLACYLERNRSAETKMLLGAIAKLEAAMRDNGHVIEDSNVSESLAAIYEAVGQARSDIAYLPSGDQGQGTTPLPTRRFAFESIPATLAEETQSICDAAASIHSAAYALQAAGVFQGVARQIIERTEAIEQSCLVQEAAINRTARMAALVSDIESELMTMFEDDGEEADYADLPDYPDQQGEISTFPAAPAHFHRRPIPEEVVEEISAALAEESDDSELGGPYGA